MHCSNFTEYDETLFAILKECKTIPNFFDCVFGFLKRKTDFFVIAENPRCQVGLPPGLAENLTRSSFNKWLSSDTTNNCEASERKAKPSVQEDKTKLATCLGSESYNGAIFENYSWSQSIIDVDITVKLPVNTNTKNLLVSIQSNKVSVKLKGSDETLFQGELCHKIKPTDAIWSIDQSKLQIHLDKVKEIWWDCLITSEERLNISQLDCSRPYEELSQEAQVKIEELTWNQERKRLGLKTTDQIDLENKLKKSWNVEGSPFRGPFNPDAVLLN